MKNACIIAEFNPFHKGHKYLIDTAKNNGATHITAVMSGNFVQRGECAVFSKYDRAVDAVKNGVDLVLELPTSFAVSSAGYFARGGVEIIEKTGCADFLFFGSECGDTEKIERTAAFLSDEKADVLIKNYCSEGFSYPNAVSKALGELSLDNDISPVSNPNDILAVEYIKALNELNSKVKPLAVKRINALHGDILDTEYSSTAVREKILKGEILTPYRIHRMNNIERVFFAKLLSLSREELCAVPGVTQGLESKIYKAVRQSASLDELYMNIKSKRFTHARIRRIVLYSLLNITENDLKTDIPYVNVLAFGNKGKDILREMRNTSRIPLIMKYSDIEKLGSKAKAFSERECYFNDIFELSSDKISAFSNQQKSSSIYVKE